MSVKFIFKCLILTASLSAIILMIIELYNVSMIAPMVRVNMNRCLNLSCQYFAQETYKYYGMDGDDLTGKELSGDKMAGNAEPLNSVEGNVGGVEFYKKDQVLSGNLYLKKTNDKAGNADQLRTLDQVYNFLYGSEEYANWYRDNRGYWRELDKLAYGLRAKGKNNFITDTDICLTGLDRDSAESEGDRYVEDYMTALNLGVTYLDKTSITNICRYELAASMSNGIPENIVMNTNTENDNRTEPVYDKAGVMADKPYVKFNGFWIYWDTFNVTDIAYERYDLGYAENGSYIESTDGNCLNGDAFQEITGINVRDYVTKNQITSDDERRYVMVARLSYTCEVRYEGTTVLSNIIRYSLDRSKYGVNGYGDEDSKVDLYDENSVKQTSKGDNVTRDTSGTQMVTDTIIYYNIR